MRCAACRQGELQPTTFVFSRVDEGGRSLHMEIDGFECPSCGELVLSGGDAEEISQQWHRVRVESAPPAMPLSSGSTASASDMVVSTAMGASQWIYARA